MKKVFLNIIKEDSGKKDKKEIEKEKISTLIVAGDSIGVGFCRAMGEKSYSDLKPPYDHIHNLIESRPSVRGATTAAWIAGRLTKELNQIGDCTGTKLVIIAGTNDALMFSRGFSKTASSAAKSVRNVINHAISKGIKKEDISVMKLHIYTGKKTRKLEDETAKKEGRESRWGKDYKNSKGKTVRNSAVDIDRMQQFIDSFNGSFSDVKTFDMVKPGGDGVHASGAGYKSLVHRACDSLNMDCSKIQIPKQSTTGTPTAVPSTGGTATTNRDCHINKYCNCVDRTVSDQITVADVQRILNKLGISVKETSSCDSQTRKAIQTFQKQQQELGFKPPDGREFLRCDACVGPNTLAAIKLELKKGNHGQVLQKISNDDSSNVSPTNASNGNVQISVSSNSNTSTNTSQFANTELKDKYTVLELYEIAKKHAPSNATDQDIRTMAAIAIAESGGRRSINTARCKNPRKNPNYKSSERRAARKRDKELGNKLQELERAYLKTNPMYFGQGGGCRFGDNSIGLWQINMINPKTKSKNLAKYGMNSEEDLKNPDKNAEVAWSYWSHPRRRFRPWATWIRKGEPGCRYTPALRKLNRILEQQSGKLTENNVIQEAKNSMSKKIKIKITEGLSCGGCGNCPVCNKMIKYSAESPMHSGGCEKSNYKNAHNSEEARMHRTTLAHLMADVKVLLDLIQDEDDLPEWLETKITKAGDYMSSAARYIAGNKARDQGQLEEVVVSPEQAEQMKNTLTPEQALEIVKKMTPEQLAPFIGTPTEVVEQLMSEGFVGLTEEILIESHFNMYELLQDAIDENGETPCPQCLYEVLSEASCGCPDLIPEAKYRGRTVKLNKPMRGDVKKFKVYVKNAKGNVVKVNFGDKKMRIKKSNPKRRKSFRARHNCKNPGPKWKARYWSCRKW